MYSRTDLTGLILVRGLNDELTSSQQLHVQGEDVALTFVKVVFLLCI